LYLFHTLNITRNGENSGKILKISHKAHKGTKGTKGTKEELGFFSLENPHSGRILRKMVVVCGIMYLQTTIVKRGLL
jgi:hypothetical protein